MLKDLAKKVFIYFGPLRLVQFLQNLIYGPSITIIFGHRVLPDHIIEDLHNPNSIAGQTSVSEVKRLIEVLSTRYEFISLDEAILKLKIIIYK